MLAPAARDLRVRGPVLAYVTGVMAELAVRPLGDASVVVRVLAARDVLELKEAGDEALFVSGFFPERVERLGLDASHYRLLGSAAYRELSARFSPAMRPVFDEMGSRFGQLQELVWSVRRACDAGAMVAKGPTTASISRRLDVFGRPV